MNNIYNILLVSSLSLGSVSAFAQKDTTLQQSMVVERDFSPIVRDANKIDQQPKQEEIAIKKSATRYADWLAPTATSSEVGVMPAGQVIATDNPESGFIKFSAGNYINADLSAGVSYKDFFAELNGFATQGDLDLPYLMFSPSMTSPENGQLSAGTWESRMMNGDVKLGIDHIFLNSSRVRAYVCASGRNYNMMNAEFIPTALVNPDLVGQYDLLYYYNPVNDPKQKAGRIGAGVAFDINTLSLYLQYHRDAENLFGCSENSFLLGGKYGWYDNDEWNFTAALNLGMQLGEENTFSFMPEIEYSRFGSTSRSRFYINAKAGVSRFELYDMLSVMPMALNVWNYGKETNLFDVTLGYENNDNGSFHYGAYIGAALTGDRLDAEMSATWSLEEMDSEFYDPPSKNYPATFARLVQDDEFEFTAGAYMNYEYSKYFKTKAGVKFSSNPRFGGEKLNVGLHFLSNPSSKLSLDLGFDGGIDRKMAYCTNYVESADDKLKRYETDVDLGNILDLNFRADYQLMDNLNIFINGKNLLNNEYQLWAGVPAQKINIHAGFKWRF